MPGRAITSQPSRPTTTPPDRGQNCKIVPTLNNGQNPFNLFTAVMVSYTLDVWARHRRVVESLEAKADNQRFAVRAEP